MQYGIIPVTRKGVESMEFKKEGQNLVITIPLGKGTPSKSGKMQLIGHTSGWIDTGVDGLKANIMVGKSSR